eukprot:s4462_g1.t1
MDFVRKVLDCQGDDWHQLRSLTQQHLNQAGTAVKPPQQISSLTRRLLKVWTPLALLRQRQALSSRLALTALAEELDEDFCIYGIMTAHFWRCFDQDLSSPSWVIERCLQRLTKGPLLNMDTREDWGPLEFSQSSRWPLHLLDLRLVQDQWQHCRHLELSFAACPSPSVPALRNAALLTATAPRPSEPSEAVQRQLLAQGQQVQMLRTKEVQMVLIGSHMGSNMEPLSMVEACFGQAGVVLKTTVLGTTYPFPEIMCESFGHCAKNSFIDDAVRLLVQQMYRPSWEPVHLLNLLTQGLEDPALQNADLFVCAQPMALCSFLRSLVNQPMLLYQAFPLVGATPVAFRHLLLVQLSEVQKSNPQRSALVAYSEFLAQQVQRQTNQRPLCLRPHSLYALTDAGRGGRYLPDTSHPRILLGRMAGWARNSAGAFVRLVEAFADDMLRPGNLRLVFLGLNRPSSETVAGLSRPFGYPELRRFRGAVYFPWDMGMLLFSELYSIGVPLFLPDRAWISSIIKRMLEYTDFGWWQARAEGSAVSLTPDSKSQLWPWFSENSTMQEILELYDLTDFVRWPYVTSFGSLSQLMEALSKADFDAISSSMLRWNDASLPLSISILSKTLAALLGNQTPPMPDESRSTQEAPRDSTETTQPSLVGAMLTSAMRAFTAGMTKEDPKESPDSSPPQTHRSHEETGTESLSRKGSKLRAEAYRPPLDQASGDMDTAPRCENSLSLVGLACEGRRKATTDDFVDEDLQGLSPRVDREDVFIKTFPCNSWKASFEDPPGMHQLPPEPGTSTELVGHGGASVSLSTEKSFDSDNVSPPVRRELRPQGLGESRSSMMK